MKVRVIRLVLQRPNPGDQTKLFALLHTEENVGVKPTTGFLLELEQSASAVVMPHPQANYIVVWGTAPRICADQERTQVATD